MDAKRWAVLLGVIAIIVAASVGVPAGQTAEQQKMNVPPAGFKALFNGKMVIENAQMPGVPARGPIGLQHRGAMRDGKWTGPPSLLQFRNIVIKVL